MGYTGVYGECLRGLRVAAGLSQEELAVRSGVSVRAIGDMERGRTRWPHRDSSRLLADALDLAGPEREKFLALARRPADGVTAEPEPTMVPYRGLSAFMEQDAELFFGRDDATARVLALMSAKLCGAGLVVVSGVSGAGKSSLLRAGVLPRLRQAGLAGVPEAAWWPRLVFTPGQRPLAELAVQIAAAARAEADTLRSQLAARPAALALTARQAALAASPDAGAASEGQRRVVLVVDQCEQLFTACGSEREREGFIAALHAAATGDGTGQGPSALVVLAVRADFEARLGDFPQLSLAVQDRYLLTVMTRRQLRLAITCPAAAAGSGAAEDLVQVLLEEAGTRPGGVAGAGSLPLLSHVLDQAWRTRTGHLLTLADYERAGGIEGAVAASAQRAYQGLTRAQQEIARQVFTRLAVPDADGSDTAVPADRADLTTGKSPAQAEDVAAVLERFSAERLLTLDAGTVQVSHEVVLTAWPLLRDDWLAGARADRLARTRLRAAAGEWVRSSRDPSWLCTGTRLEAAEGAAARITADPRQVPLSQEEKDFLLASRRANQRRARARHELAMVLLALVCALTTTWVMAVRAGQTASAQRDIALSRLLISKSEALGGTDATAARLEAIAAYALDPSPQARYAMLSVAASPQIATITAGPAAVVSVVFSPGGRFLATGCSDDLIRLWDVTSGRQIGKPLPSGLSPIGKRTGPAPAGAVPVAFSPDGTFLATGEPDGVQLWNIATDQPVGGPFAVPGGLIAVAFSPDGKTLAAAGPGGVQLWNIATDQPTGKPVTAPGGATSVAFSPDGDMLAAGGRDGTQLWNVATNQPTGKPLNGETGPVTSVAFSPHGKTLASAGPDGVQLWNIATAQPAGKPIAAPGGATSVAFSPDGEILATGGSSTRIWNAVTGHQIGAPLTDGNSGPTTMVAFSPDGRTLATGGLDGTARLWDVAATTFSRQLGSLDPDVVGMQTAFSPDGETLASASLAGAPGAWVTARLLDVKTGHQIDRSLTVASLHGTWALAVTPDGATLASITASGVRLQYIATARQIGKVLALGRDQAISMIALSTDHKTLATIRDDGTAQLWDVATHRQIGKVTAGASEAVFSPDLRTLAAMDSHGISLWDMTTDRRIGTPLPVSAASALVFSPDSKTLAVIGDNDITLWDAATGKQVGSRISGVDLNVVAAFSPDGTTLATGSQAGTVQLWDLTTGQQIGQDLTVGDGKIDAVAFSPDGTTLATSSQGMTQLWDVGYLTDPLRQLCGRPGGSLTAASWARFVQAGTPYRNVCPQARITDRPHG